MTGSTRCRLFILSCRLSFIVLPAALFQIHRRADEDNGDSASVAPEPATSCSALLQRRQLFGRAVRTRTDRATRVGRQRPPIRADVASISPRPGPAGPAPSSHRLPRSARDLSEASAAFPATPTGSLDLAKPGARPAASTTVPVSLADNGVGGHRASPVRVDGDPAVRRISLRSSCPSDLFTSEERLRRRHRGRSLIPDQVTCGSRNRMTGADASSRPPDVKTMRP